MNNPELCCNCAHWTICKAEGVMPNDYCGLYQSEMMTDEQEKKEDHMTFEKHYIKKAFPHYTDEMMDAYIQGFNERGDFDEKLKLAMRAGAYAIRNNSSLQNGCFNEMPWTEAEKILICTAEGLDPDEWEIKHDDRD